MPELPSDPPYFLVSRKRESTYWANLLKHDESHYHYQRACVAASMKHTQFLSSPVGMLYWAGLTTLSQFKGKDKGGEVPNNRFQTVTIQAQKGIKTNYNCFSEGRLYKEEKLYQKQFEAYKSVKARILCWRCRINTNIVGECGDLFELQCCFLVLTQLSNPHLIKNTGHPIFYSHLFLHWSHLVQLLFSTSTSSAIYYFQHLYFTHIVFSSVTPLSSTSFPLLASPQLADI